MDNRYSAILLRQFVTLAERIDKKVNVSRHLRLLLRYASRFIESKIHKSCKSEVKPQIKVVIVQQSAALPGKFKKPAERTCPICKIEMEDEYHLLNICPAYQEKRCCVTRLFEKRI